MVLKLTLEYDGSNYSGWQLQPRHDSIQGRIEAALERIFAAPVRVYGSGRTDAGVHARGQVASISTSAPIRPRRIAARAQRDAAGRHRGARRLARARRLRSAARRPLARVRISRVESQGRVRLRVSLQLAGPRPPRSRGDELRRAHLCRRARFRRVPLARHRSEDHDPPRDCKRWTRDGDVLVYRVEANSFLRHMVRAMVAAMVDVGRGKLTPDKIAAILAGTRSSSGSRQRAARRPVTSSKSATDGAIVQVARSVGAKTLGAQCARDGPVQKPSRSLEKIAIFVPSALEIVALLVHPH